MWSCIQVWVSINDRYLLVYISLINFSLLAANSERPAKQPKITSNEICLVANWLNRIPPSPVCDPSNVDKLPSNSDRSVTGSSGNDPAFLSSLKTVESHKAPNQDVKHEEDTSSKDLPLASLPKPSSPSNHNTNGSSTRNPSLASLSHFGYPASNMSQGQSIDVSHDDSIQLSGARGTVTPDTSITKMDKRKQPAPDKSDTVSVSSNNINAADTTIIKVDKGKQRAWDKSEDAAGLSLNNDINAADNTIIKVDKGKQRALEKSEDAAGLSSNNIRASLSAQLSDFLKAPCKWFLF